MYMWHSPTPHTSIENIPAVGPVLSRQLVDNLESRVELERILVDILAAAASMKQLAPTGTEIETMPSWVLDWRQTPSYNNNIGLQPTTSRR